jgi:hypothetical protein
MWKASPESTVPINQRCTTSQVGRRLRNIAIEPAQSLYLFDLVAAITAWLKYWRAFS